MKETIINILLFPILVYLFGYYYPEYMMNNYRATVQDCILYIIVASHICIVFMFRRKRPKDIHQIFFWLSYGGACLYSGLMLTEITDAYNSEKALITLLCMIYIIFFSRITRNPDIATQYTKWSVILLCISAWAAAAINVIIVSSLMRDYREIMIIPACLFFLGCVLYPLNVVFSVLERDNKKIE